MFGDQLCEWLLCRELQVLKTGIISSCILIFQLFNLILKILSYNSEKKIKRKFSVLVNS